MDGGHAGAERLITEHRREPNTPPGCLQSLEPPVSSNGAGLWEYASRPCESAQPSEPGARCGSELPYPGPVKAVPERDMFTEAGGLPRMDMGQKPEGAALELHVVHHAVGTRIRPVRR